MDMKRILGLCGAMAVCLSASAFADEPTPPAAPPSGTGQAAPAATPVDGPRLTLEVEDYDAGRVFSRDPVTFNLKFKNTGNSTLEIQKVNTSCGCTTTKLEQLIYQPGESGVIEVVYRPKTPGKSTAKMVTISSNDPANPATKFTIRATLIEPALLEPERLQLGQIRAGEGAEAVFTVTSPDKNFEIESVTDETGMVTFEIRDGGESENPEFPGKKLIVAKLAKKLPGGPLQIPVKVKVKAIATPDTPAVENELQCAILGHVLGDLENEPRFLRVPTAAANQPFEVKTLLYSQSGKPFEITKVEVTDANISDVQVTYTKASEAETGKVGYWLTLKGNPGDVHGAFRGRIFVHTDLPDEGPKLITFNGVVRADVTATSSTGN